MTKTFRPQPHLSPDCRCDACLAWWRARGICPWCQHMHAEGEPCKETNPGP